MRKRLAATFMKLGRWIVDPRSAGAGNGSGNGHFRELAPSRTSSIEASRLTDLVRVAGVNPPALWNRGARKDYEKRQRIVGQAVLNATEIHAQAATKQLAIEADATIAATVLRAETLLHRMRQCAHIQRQGAANASYEAVMDMATERLDFLDKVARRYPRRLVEAEKRRTVAKLKRDLTYSDDLSRSK